MCVNNYNCDIFSYTTTLRQDVIDVLEMFVQYLISHFWIVTKAIHFVVLYMMQTGTFNETCLMIRKPALEVIDFLKNLNMSHMVPRFLLCIFHIARTMGISLAYMLHCMHYDVLHCSFILQCEVVYLHFYLYN